MYEINVKARAKINLSLDVINKRQDGYHNVKMVMQQVALYDNVYIRKTKKQGIFLKTNLKYLPVNDKNLAYKAAELIINNYSLDKGVYIYLNKRIPVAAGLAGGSSNAAAVLVGMNKLFNLNISLKTLMELGKQLGADVPYCIKGGTCLAEGIGEILTELPNAPKGFVVLAKPNISVSTPLVYKSLDVKGITNHLIINDIIKGLQQKDLMLISKSMGNVLENVTISKYPILQNIKNFMMDNGALGSLMSGSGPTIFGLFNRISVAKDVVYQLKLNNICKNVYLTSLHNE